MEIRECSWSWRTPLARRSETTRIILHHAAAASCTAEDVHRWHLARGWSGIGYHYFVSKDGEITRGRPLWAVGAHAEGSNRVSVGVCFEGNFQLEEEMPAAQRQAGRALVTALRSGIRQRRCWATATWRRAGRLARENIFRLRRSPERRRRAGRRTKSW